MTTDADDLADEWDQTESVPPLHIEWRLVFKLKSWPAAAVRHFDSEAEALRAVQRIAAHGQRPLLWRVEKRWVSKWTDRRASPER